MAQDVVGRRQMEEELRHAESQERRSAGKSSHPEKPFDHAEKAYWLQRDADLKAFVDRWIAKAKERWQLCEDSCGLV